MNRRFDYVKYDAEACVLQILFKHEFQNIEEQMTLSLKDGRAKSLALTAIEEAYMWIGKAIRDEQIARTPNVPDVPERTNA